MATKIYSKPVNKHFLGNCNPSKMEVHDLYHQITNCQIDDILNAGHAVVFTPDTLEQAQKEGYDNCAYCIGGSEK